MKPNGSTSTCPKCGGPSAEAGEWCSGCFRAAVTPPAPVHPVPDYAHAHEVMLRTKAAEDVIRSIQASDPYAAFLARKQLVAPLSGIKNPEPVSPRLWKWQRAIVRWALKRGKAAIFADTGLGKGWMTLEWSRIVRNHTKRPVLILAPLAVAQQFVREGLKLYGDNPEGDGAVVRFVSDQREVDALEREATPLDPPMIYVTNYQKLHKFDAASYVGIACDESGILKSFDGSTRTTLIETFRETPYRLCGSATPAPNQFDELGNTSEFLGILTRTEMLSEFFIHDGGSTQNWRPKGHAVGAFFAWVASWAAAVKKPSDLGFPNDGYDLPPLRHHVHEIPVSREETLARGSLFAEAAEGLNAQRAARRASLDKRVAKAAEIARGYITEGFSVIAWCELNDEQDALAAALGDACYSVQGRNTDDEKEASITAWLDRKRPAMVSKGAVMGHGLNCQICSKVIFVGATNSFEMYYQTIRRCWRFGQTQPVDVHVVYSEAELRVLENLERKQAAAMEMGSEMSLRVSAILREELTKETTRMLNDYDPKVEMRVPEWLT